ncbi:hypothetical protein [Flavobacterium sp.]|uniref:hypothetical protein n=1 Tax=Flavobacterium sp. TaxID=239 RepID=UPI0026022E7B|nr:hypothetical protein [Flavobacterium sp.]
MVSPSLIEDYNSFKTITMRALIATFFQDVIAFSIVENIVLPILAGLSVLYIGMQFFQKNNSEKLVSYSPSFQETIATFLQSFFSNTWDTIETEIELDYFKTKVLKGNPENLREFTAKLFVANSPYCLPGNRTKLALLMHKLELNAFLNRTIASGTLAQKVEAIQFAVIANSQEALPFLETELNHQSNEVRFQSIKAILLLNGLQPTLFNAFSIPLSDAEYAQLVKLYTGKTQNLLENIGNWLIDATPQLVKFCLLLAKEFQIPLDTRTLQGLGFHQDKKIAAMAIELLDNYILENQASKNLQQLRKEALLQHKTKTTSANSNIE